MLRIEPETPSNARSESCETAPLATCRPQIRACEKGDDVEPVIPRRPKLVESLGETGRPTPQSQSSPKVVESRLGRPVIPHPPKAR